MGWTRVEDSDRGQRVIGSGKSPRTGENLNGRAGTIEGVKRIHGEEVVKVKWEGSNEVDCVRQENVSGTGMV